MSETSTSNQRQAFIKTILEDDKSAVEEEEILHRLLKEYISKNSISPSERRI